MKMIGVKTQLETLAKDLGNQFKSFKTKVAMAIKFEPFYPELYRHEIEDIQMARAFRYDPEDPRTYKLQEVYKDSVKMDAHLRAAMRNRTLRCSNKRYVFKDADDNLDEDRTKFLLKAWFKKTLKWAHESNHYGYTLIYPNKFEVNGQIKEVRLLPRGHVVPEKGILVKDVLDDKGLPYEEAPNWLWYAELGEDAIGSLETCSVLCILKRHSWASWDVWEQIFGQPIRIAYTRGGETHKQNVASWLAKMGKMAYGVFTQDVDKVEMVESKKVDAYQVFDKKREAVNEEISKIINGQTMTMDNGSSKAQGETHLKTEKEITKDDIDSLLLWLNDVIVPALRHFGYDIPEGHRIDVEETTVASEKIKIDTPFISAGYRLNKDYIKRVYNTEIEDYPGENEGKDPDKEAGGGASAKKSLRGAMPQTAKRITTLKELYDCGCAATVLKSEDDRLINTNLERLADQVLSGKLASGDLDPTLYGAYYSTLMSSIREGFTKASVRLGEPNQKVLQEIRLNAATFGAFKNHSFVEDLVGLLYDSEGNLVSKGEFVKRALKLDGAYNGRWFAAERDMVIGKSQGAIKWNAFQKRKHLYKNVIRREIIDKRTRPHHVKLNGLIVSLDDPILDTHWAPDEPGCRGTQSQTNREVDKRGLDFEELNTEVTPWNINPGKFGRIVSDDHPYFKSKKLKAVAKRAQLITLKFQRKELMEFYKGKNFAVKTTDGKKVQVTRTRVDYLMKHPTFDINAEFFRNELLFNLEETIKRSSFVETQTVRAGKHPEAAQFHVYSITLHERVWFLKFKELKDRGDILLNSISERK